MLLDVSILNPIKVIFEGKAKKVILPGEAGTFEILPFHKRILSRLVAGTIIVDQQGIPIRRGIVKVNQNMVTIILEEK